MTDTAKNNLREDMKSDAGAAFSEAPSALAEEKPLIPISVEEMQARFIADFEKKIAATQQVSNQYFTPIDESNLNKEGIHGTVGYWNLVGVSDHLSYKKMKKEFTKLGYTTPSSKPAPQKPHKVIERDKISKIHPTEETKRLAVYSTYTQNITLYDFSNTEKYKAAIKSSDFNTDIEYIKGNSIIEQIFLIHEAVHNKHTKQDRIGDLNITPLNAMRGNHLTETTAKAAEYLALANMYAYNKKTGINQLCVAYKDGHTEEWQLEKLLELYPGLSDAVAKCGENGFDPNNKEHVRNIVQAASKNWHFAYMPSYRKQTLESGKVQNILLGSLSLNEQVKTYQNEEQDWEKQSHKMLQNVYIGLNTNVDLTHCADILNTFDANRDENNLSDDCDKYEERKESVMQVNAYFESKGITKAEDKDAYIAEQFGKIILRQPDFDPEFKNILTDNGKKRITYADGLEEYPCNGMPIVQDPEGNTYALNELKLAHSLETIDKAPSNEQTNTAALSPALIKARQNGR